MKRPHAVFAYGSNMHLDQTFERCPEAELVGPGQLENWRLLFAGHSGRWGGAVATISASIDHVVPGLLFRLTDTDLCRLDAFEGAPYVYERSALLVREKGALTRQRAFVYQIRRLELGAPSAPYLTQIWSAYREWGFSPIPLADALAESCKGKHHRVVRDTARRIMAAANGH